MRESIETARESTEAMVDPDKAVFISYRRKLSPFVARSIFENLTNHGYDVFMDVESLDSGNFETIILHQIAARTHFLAVLTPGSLEPTSESGDWLRREIEYAIKLKRNVVPVMAMGFEFGKEAENFPQRKLPGGVEALRSFNGIDVPHNYFDDAMRKLRERFLKKPIAIAITPAPDIEFTDVKRKIRKVMNLVPDQSILSTFGLKPSPFSKIPWFTLKAPTLSMQQPNLLLLSSLKWTTVLGATSYVLEGSPTSSVLGYTELYKGEKTEFSVFPVFSGFSSAKYFRVKGENKVLSVESPWSNVVTDPEDPPVTGISHL